MKVLLVVGADFTRLVNLPDELFLFQAGIAWFVACAEDTREMVSYVMRWVRFRSPPLASPMFLLCR